MMNLNDEKEKKEEGQFALTSMNQDIVSIMGKRTNHGVCECVS